MSVERENRIDLFRGISLLLIFVGHSNFTFSEAVQNARGFADASEMFVMLAGMSAALAYYVSPAGIGEGKLHMLRPWRRARTIYLVHVSLIVGLAILAGILTSVGGDAGVTILDALGVRDFWDSPLRRSMEGMILTYMPGDLDILPLYVLLVLLAPLLFWGYDRSKIALVVSSCAVWLLGGLTHVNLVNTGLATGHWYFNPLSWQFIFLIGIVIGIDIKERGAALPYKAAIFAAALSFALAAIPLNIVYHFHLAEPPLPGLYKALVSKTNVGVLRLLDILAVLYVAWNIPAIKRAAAHPALQPLCVLGKHSLPVFVLGIVLSNIILCLMELQPRLSIILQLALLVTGAIAQILLGQFLETRRAQLRQASASPVMPHGSSNIVAQKSVE